jgi:hypothetical protein
MTPSDEKPILSTWVAKGTGAFGCLVALAIIPLVAVVVNLIAGEDQLPDEIQGTTPWFLGAAVLFGGIAFWWYRKTRRRFELVETAKGLEVRVAGVTLVTTPVELAYGWEKQHIKAGLQITILMLGIIKDGQCVLTLTEEWGAIHGEPEGWKQGWPSLPTGPFSQHYKAMGGRFVADLARILGAEQKRQ